MEQDEGFAVRDVLRVLAHYKRLIAAVIALALVAAFVYSYAQPTRYTAQTQLVVGPAISDAALPDARGATNGPLGLDLPAETQARIIASPLIAERVARLVDGTSDIDEAHRLGKSVQVKALTENAYLISVDADTAVRAAALSNGFATEYLASRREATRKALLALAKSQDNQAEAKNANQLQTVEKQLKEARDANSSTRVAELEASRSQILDEIRTLTASSQQLAQLAASDLGVGQVIATAEPARDGKSPSPTRNLVMALILGSVLGVSLALVLEHLGGKVTTRDEAAVLAKRSVIATLPARRRRQRSPQLATVDSPASAAADGYRALKGHLVRHGLRQSLRGVAVTGVSDGPQIAETAANLAVLCARGGIRTVLVSADLRDAHIDTLFSMTELPGVADLLVDRNRTAADWALVARPVPASPSLTVVPAGTAAKRALNPLPDDRFGALLASIYESAEVVIVALPAAARGDDALGVAVYLDGVVLTVTVDRDRQQEVSRIATLIRSAGCRLEGLVLHNARKNDHSTGLLESSGLDDSAGFATVWDEHALLSERQADDVRTGRDASADG